MSVVPSEQELATSISSLRAEEANLSILKLLARLRLDHPEWTVSEARFRKLLRAVVPNTSTTPVTFKVQTGFDDHLGIAELSPKVTAHDYGAGKGKGLIATATLQQGELIWYEAPWIVVPSQ